MPAGGLSGVAVIEAGNDNVEASGATDQPVQIQVPTEKVKVLPPPPFKVGDGLPVVPPKLVAKIQRGEFVDMSELLKDNIEADRRRSLQDQGAAAAALMCSVWMSGKSGGRREVPDILSWVQCFATYACVLGEAHPEKTKELWAYMSLIVREARRCGGSGWREYDGMFRQQAPSAINLEWGKLDGSLYAVTFLAHQSGRGRLCRWCQESDHQSGDCALVPDRQSSSAVVPSSSLETKQTSSSGREGRTQGRSGRSEKICYSWNAGKCRFHPYCRFRHVCSTVGCNEDHRAIECPAASRSRSIPTDPTPTRVDSRSRQ